MTFDPPHHDLRWTPVLGVALLTACVNAQRTQADLGLSGGALEQDCAAAPADVTGDITAILSSIEPLDPAQPQQYGSALCAGVVFEFDNPDDEATHGAWIQAGGESGSESDVLSESQCPARTLEAEYWGYAKKEWLKLAGSSQLGSFAPGELPSTGYCKLESQLDHSGTFEKLRIMARVIHAEVTYPMYATVW